MSGVKTMSANGYPSVSISGRFHMSFSPISRYIGVGRSLANLGKSTLVGISSNIYSAISSATSIIDSV